MNYILINNAQHDHYNNRIYKLVEVFGEIGKEHYKLEVLRAFTGLTTTYPTGKIVRLVANKGTEVTHVHNKLKKLQALIAEKEPESNDNQDWDFIDKMKFEFENGAYPSEDEFKKMNRLYRTYICG